MNSIPPSRPPPLPPSKRSTRHFPHIRDLIARTEGLNATERPSIKSWIELAAQHWMQAKAHRNFNRLDTAYVDYLLAFTIVVDVVPKHAEYPTFRVSNQPSRRQLQTLRDELQAQTDEYNKVKEVIVRDNEASGVLSAEEQLAVHQRTETQNSNHGGLRRRNDVIPSRPAVRAKPEHLSSRTVSPGNSSDTNISGAVQSSPDLEARLEKLGAGKGLQSVSRANGSSRLSESSRTAPNGPRDMPQKLPPLDIINALPQVPAPTYSPTTSYASPGGLSPPRSSLRNSLAMTGPLRQDGSVRRNPQIPENHLLQPDSLIAFLKGGSGVTVLLLDVRSREEFNLGHIYHRSIVCVEPVTLRDGMSGENLDQTFVLSTTAEGDLFAKRGEYDMVVYYDQSTASDDFQTALATDETGAYLRTLHKALHDYAYKRPLRRPPYLLVGGLEAWIEEVGQQSLKTEDGESHRAIGATGSDGSGNWRRSMRERVEGEASRIPNRAPTPLLLERMSGCISAAHYPSRDGNGVAGSSIAPINIEEEKRWLEQLHKESEPILSTSRNLEDTRKQRREPYANSEALVPVRTVEEFFLQYPASPHAQESMSFASTQHDPTSLIRRNTIIDHPFHVFTDVRNPDFHPPSSPARPPPVATRKSYSGVSERLAPAASHLVPVAPKLARLGMPSADFGASFTGAGYLSVGKTGLKNLGNTCYMNSILQCMSGTIPLVRYFLDGSYKSHVNKDNPLGSRGVLAEAFGTVLRHLWSGEYKFISPVTFKEVAGRLNETFKTNDQQDAQEFLEFLLDGLHEDLNPNANRTKLNPLSEKEERNREKLPLQVASLVEWKRYVHQNFSIVVNWLQGQLASKLRCLTCNTTSTTYTPFMYLSLPIPVKNVWFTLYDCLREFVKEETLDGDDAWHCPQCKVPRKATKQLTITRLPTILIIHLKRFTSRGRWGDKLSTPIDFPLAGLDLTGYMPTPLASTVDEEHEPPIEVTPPFLYDLYGIANHYGTLHGGHYTSFVRNPYKGTWNTFDDSKATQMDESSVVSRNAYVLFWVRTNVM